MATQILSPEDRARVRGSKFDAYDPETELMVDRFWKLYMPLTRTPSVKNADVYWKALYGLVGILENRTEWAYGVLGKLEEIYAFDGVVAIDERGVNALVGAMCEYNGVCDDCHTKLDVDGTCRNENCDEFCEDQ